MHSPNQSLVRISNPQSITQDSSAMKHNFIETVYEVKKKKFFLCKKKKFKKKNIISGTLESKGELIQQWIMTK